MLNAKESATPVLAGDVPLGSVSRGTRLVRWTVVPLIRVKVDRGRSRHGAATASGVGHQSGSRQSVGRLPRTQAIGGGFAHGNSRARVGIDGRAKAGGRAAAVEQSAKYYPVFGP